MMSFKIYRFANIFKNKHDFITEYINILRNDYINNENNVVRYLENNNIVENDLKLLQSFYNNNYNYEFIHKHPHLIRYNKLNDLIYNKIELNYKISIGEKLRDEHLYKY